MFTVGAVLVLGMALIIVLIFRYLDRGNRSLEKVKRFTGRLREELASIELNQWASHVEEIQTRIDQYDLALKQLVEMTNQAEQNIKGTDD